MVAIFSKKWAVLFCSGVALAVTFQNCGSNLGAIQDTAESQSLASVSEKNSIHSFMQSHLNEPVTNGNVTVIFKGDEALEYRAKNAPWIDVQGQVSYHDVVCSFNMEVQSEPLAEGHVGVIKMTSAKSLASSSVESVGICQLLARDINGFSYQVGKYENFALSANDSARGRSLVFNFWSL